MEKGFTEIRTVRVISFGIFFVGILQITFARVLDFVQALGQNAVDLGLARYSNFTGRFAARNFAEDRQLLHFLNLLNDTLLPVVQVLVPILMIFGLLMVAFGFFMWIFPQTGAQVYVAFHCLEPVSGSHWNKSENPRSAPRGSAIAVAVVILVILGSSFLIRDCSDNSEDNKAMANEVSEEASHYIELQKKYFGDNKRVGSWKDIGYESTASEYFEYENPGIGFWRAVSREPRENCPAGKRWRVQMKVEGVFEKTLKIYVSTPADEACVKLTPDFKKVRNANKQDTDKNSAKKP